MRDQTLCRTSAVSVFDLGSSGTGQPPATSQASNISLTYDSSFCVVQMSDAMFCHGALLVLL
jgi:hypothetical protein